MCCVSKEDIRHLADTRGRGGEEVIKPVGLSVQNCMWYCGGKEGK